jgi:hypothetical protein
MFRSEDAPKSLPPYGEESRVAFFAHTGIE